MVVHVVVYDNKTVSAVEESKPRMISIIIVMLCLKLIVVLVICPVHETNCLTCILGLYLYMLRHSCIEMYIHAYYNT